MLKPLLPGKVKVNITIEDIRRKSNLPTNRTIRFIERFFFGAMLGFTKSHSRPLSEVDGFIQLIPGTYKSDKPNKITGIDKVPLKCDCLNGSNVDGIREPIL